MNLVASVVQKELPSEIKNPEQIPSTGSIPVHGEVKVSHATANYSANKQ